MLCAAIFCANQLRADASKISPELLSSQTSSSVKVIIQYQKPVNSGMGSKIGAVGAILTDTFSFVKTLVATVPVSKLQALSDLPEVTYISPDRTLKQSLDYSAAAVNASAAWNAQLTGAGVGVAVIDSGVAEQADLSLLGTLSSLSRVVYHQDFTKNNQPLSSKDQYGHGTHVAGIIAGNGVSSACLNCTRTLKGIAPMANIIDLRVLDKNGQGSDSAVIAAIDQAIMLKQIYNIRVINLSLGRPIYESYQNDPLCQAVEQAWKAGLVVVVAAGNNGRDNWVGNNGYGTIQSPANDPYVITVGAMKAMSTFMRTDDLIASYSSKGPSAIDFVTKPDILAPGNHVVSLEVPNSTLAKDPTTAVPVSYYMATNSGKESSTFMMLNGTSMATPVVSGAVADLLQANPSLTPDAVKARLMKTAYKTFPTTSTAVDQVTGQMYTSAYDLFTVGAGYLDLGAALANHDVVSGNALSPLASYNTNDGSVYLVFDPASVWNSAGGSLTANLFDPQTVWGSATVQPARAVWGTTTVTSTRAVWGTSDVNGTRAVWGTNAVWGSSGVDGFNAIWGTRGVWGTATDQGTATLQGTRGVWGTDAATSDSDYVFNINQ